MQRGYVTSIRFLSLIFKFLFILYLSKNISVELFGEYGYLISLVFFVSLLVGFEAGTLQSRKIIECKTKSEESYIYFSIIIETFIMWLICSIILFFLNLGIDLYILIIVLLIALLESINTELKKILISKNLNLFSSYIDLIRVSLWSILYIFYIYFFNNNLIEFKFIFIFYLIASLISFILIIKKLKPNFRIKFFKKDSAFFENKIKTLPFFIYGLTLLFYEISGRFILKYLGLQFDLGIFTFYSSFIFSISLFIWSFNVSFVHKDILTLFSQNLYKSAYKKVNSLILRSIFLFFLISIFVFVAVHIMIDYFNLYEYRINLYSFLLFFMIPFLNILDTQFNYFLYGHKKDSSIGVISFISILFFAFLFFYVEIESFIEILELLILSFSFSLLIKIFNCILITKKYANS